jgi:hypothetical protein
VSAIWVSYAASAQISLVAGAGVHSELSGETADQLSVALAASCHISVAASTPDQTSGVPSSTSHFSTARAANAEAIAIEETPPSVDPATAATFDVAEICGAIVTLNTADEELTELAETIAEVLRSLKMPRETLAEQVEPKLARATLKPEADMLSAELVAADTSTTVTAAEDAEVDDEATAPTSRVLTASTAALDANAMAESATRTLTAAETVADTVITALATGVLKPPKP